jgi:serine/threonine protein kinase
MPMTHPSSSLIGQVLMQRYLILEPLESGGFSQTYLAIDTAAPDNHACVIKFMDAQSNTDVDFAQLSQLFEAEAYALGCLGAQATIDPSGRSTPLLLGYGREQTQVYLVQELIEGERLDAWMASAPQPRLKDVIEILQSSLIALEQIHRQGIIHCDLKPSNLIRRMPDHHLVLIDFGACSFSGQSTIRASATDANPHNHPEFALGTPGYMPPEQAAGLPQFNSDLYALGMMAIQILTGIAPKNLDRYPTTREWNWHAHIRKSLLNLELIPILDRMVRLDYRNRYHTATAALNAIQNLNPQSSSSRLPLFRLQPPTTNSRQHDPTAPTLCKSIQHHAPSVPNAPTRPYRLITTDAIEPVAAPQPQPSVTN